MNLKAKEFLLSRNANMANASRYVDGVERLKFDVEFVNSYIPAGGVCLDLCCGTGMMTIEIAKKAQKVYAVDFNETFIKQIKDDPRIIKVVSDASDFCIDERFDVITIFGAIQYNTGNDVKKIYENCYRMLKEKGVLIISGQWGNKEKVIVDKFSQELQKQYFAEYRTINEETVTLNSIGFDTETVTILPERFNHYDNTHFSGIVAKKGRKRTEKVPKYNDTIGIIGGMGSFATLDFFRRLLQAFPGEKEWDRPRIIIDNRCTMPSRVRAILYNENRDHVLECLVDSTKNLLKSGATILILACNTSHVFIEDIIRMVPEAENKFINIIDVLGKWLSCNNKIDNYRLIASEGTIESGVYQKYFKKYNLLISAPSKEQYSKLRSLIEDVKQDKITRNTVDSFVELMRYDLKNKNVIIGCTEFPMIYCLVKDRLKEEGYVIYDPLEIVIEEIKNRIR